MKKLLFALPLLIIGCGPTDPHDVSLDHLLTNPLFAERYAEETVDAVVELKIQNDPILEDSGVANAVEKVRAKWLEVARDATKTQREGTTGILTIVNAYGKGEFLYLNDVLYTDTLFEVIPGPDLHLYLSTVVDPRDVEFPDNSSVHIGNLKSPYGAQRYDVASQENPELYRTVVLWDKTLKRIWGFAQLSN